MPSRFYQRKAKTAVGFSFEEYDSTLVVMGTGGGKTYTGADLIKEWLPGRTLWLADQDELCTQPLKTISKVAGVIPALEKGGSRSAGKDVEIVVGSLQTLRRKDRIELWEPDYFDYLIIDEAHRNSDAAAKIRGYFEKSKSLGFTATPFRKNHADLSEWYEDVAYSMPISDNKGGANGLIQQGFAPPIRTEYYPVEIDLSKVETKKEFGEEEFDDEQLANAIEPYYDEMCRLIAIKAKGRHIIVFLPLIETSKAFAECARKHGISAKHVDGSSPDREEILEGFAQGYFSMLCNAGVVSTGVDLPIADCFVNLKLTRSISWYFQAIGRIMRVLPGVIDDLPEEHQAEERKARIAASAKPDCMVIDFMFQHDNMCVHAGHLVADSEEDARRIFEKSKKLKSPEDLAKIAAEVRAEHENAVIKRLDYAASQIRGRLFQPEIIGFLIGDKAIMDYQPVRRWEIKPPSEQQIERLRKFHIEPESVKSYGMASMLIDKFFTRIKTGMATVPQLRAIHNLGLKEYEDLTFAEAGRILSAGGDRKSN